MNEEVAQDQSCRHPSPLNAMDQLWNTEPHVCLDKHLNDPHYYTTIKRKSDVSLSLQMCRRTFKQSLYPKNTGSLKHQKHCSEAPLITQELWWEHKKKTDWKNSPPSKVLGEGPARQSSGSCGSWVAPDPLRCSAHMCSHASHTDCIHSKAKVQNRMFTSSALHVYPWVLSPSFPWRQPCLLGPEPRESKKPDKKKNKVFSFSQQRRQCCT